ncbi:HIT family protein [Lacisediminimonas profundi]|uniref:HIT family protein n=1 Tax=Lacisediminimonas profundi TaxID=2603856 RepID=UPI00124B43D0|nr:HIT domain-containing protein [Lacisediminimonas profundi]
MSTPQSSHGTCLFCDIPQERIFLQNEYAYAIFDGYPVTPLHALIIPKRHVDSFFELTDTELLQCKALLSEARQKILDDDRAVDGFNIGVNAGATAGQTIFHCHIHLIPRRAGDVENPRGGVRHLIPGKGFY